MYGEVKRISSFNYFALQSTQQIIDKHHRNKLYDYMRALWSSSNYTIAKMIRDNFMLAVIIAIVIL